VRSRPVVVRGNDALGTRSIISGAGLIYIWRVLFISLDLGWWLTPVAMFFLVFGLLGFYGKGDEASKTIP
jgi:hypothetical protein